MARQSKYKARRLLAAQRRVEVARLYHELTRAKHPAPQMEIAKRLGISSACVSTDLKALSIEWREARIDAVEDHKRLMLRRLDWQESEIKAEWARSKLDSETLRTEGQAQEVPCPACRGQDSAACAQCNGTGTVTIVVAQGGRKAKVEKTVKGQTGLCAYQTALLAIEERRAKLLGIDAPQKIDVLGARQRLADLLGVSPDELPTEPAKPETVH